jgi:hypothetical protein
MVIAQNVNIIEGRYEEKAREDGEVGIGFETRRTNSMEIVVGG